MLFSQATQCRPLRAIDSRGAKVALYLALTKPEIAAGLVSVENAPIASQLSPSFQRYTEAMKTIDDAKFTKRKDAEKVLEKIEWVCSLNVYNTRMSVSECSF
jgi:hypothetical protein